MGGEMRGMSRWGRSQTWEQTDPAAQEARPGGAGGRGGLPLSPCRGSAGGSFPEDSGHGGERKRRRQLHNIWQRRSPPGTPRRPITGGPSQHRASCHPSAARCAPPLPLAPLHPHPSSPPAPLLQDMPNTCIPVQSQFTGASQFSPSSPALPGPCSSPQCPGDRRPRHHPLVATGDTISSCPQMGHVPLAGTTVPLPSARPGAQQPRDWGDPAEQGRGAGPAHPSQHFPPNSSCPGILLDTDCPEQGAAHRPAPANSWVRLKSKTGLAAGRENSLSPQK